MRKIILSLGSILFFLVFALPAQAQDGAHLDIYDLQTSGFPTITVSLNAYDTQGVFISGLAANDIAVLEDGQLIPVLSLEERQPGVQFVVAVNPGPSFAIRDDQAVSRYEKISRALQNWASSLPVLTSDDLSLVTNSGTDAAHLANSQHWLANFVTYQPAARTLTPSLESLSRALDLASEPTLQPGMKHVVLYITPIALAGDVPTLQNLAARAVDLNICIFVWAVGTADEFNTSPATAIKELAVQTGGQIFLFSGTESLPSPEDYLRPLRHTYQLSYYSNIRSSGSHTLSAQMNVDGGTTSSSPLTFNLDVQPPNPILVSPPEQIIREVPGDGSFNALNLLPAIQTIEMIIEFPDGHTRPISRTALYVDGQLAAENTSVPFDIFTWDLSAYSVDSQYMLQVEVTDSLGLRKASLGYPVTVTVIQPPHGLLPFLKRNSLWISLGAVSLAGITLVLILFASGRVRLPPPGKRHSSRQMSDPVTQPVHIPGRKPGPHLAWLRRQKPAPAYLVRLRSDGQESPGSPIPLPGRDITFGTDPTQANHVLDDPSVSPLHSQIRQTDAGDFLLMDRKSVAGTWINLVQVPPEGRLLRHNDVIHIGQLSFRFRLHKPPERPAPYAVAIKSSEKHNRKGRGN